MRPAALPLLGVCAIFMSARKSNRAERHGWACVLELLLPCVAAFRPRRPSHDQLIRAHRERATGRSACHVADRPGAWNGLVRCAHEQRPAPKLLLKCRQTAVVQQLLMEAQSWVVVD
jgi:hypothetical protein